jgi:hypothetical protein
LYILICDGRPYPLYGMENMSLSKQFITRLIVNVIIIVTIWNSNCTLSRYFLLIYLIITTSNRIELWIIGITTRAWYIQKFTVCKYCLPKFDNNSWRYQTTTRTLIFYRSASNRCSIMRNWLRNI